MPWPQERPASRYPSDLTDEEWEILQPIFEQLDPHTRGRPREVDLREVVNAIFISIKRAVNGVICPKIFPITRWSVIIITSGSITALGS